MQDSRLTSGPFRKSLPLVAGAVALCLLAGLLLRFSGVAVWDDAYFFVRYADNYIDAGVYGWNAGESPAYGLTSLAFGVQALGLRILVDGEAAGVLWVSSLIWGLTGLALIVTLVRRFADTYGRFSMSVLIMTILAIGFNLPYLVQHFGSGMDTTLAIAYMSLYLIFLNRFASNLSPGKALVLGLLGGFAWFIRPELLVFTLGAPLCLAIFSKTQLMRRQAGYILIFSAFALFAQVLLAMQYFGTFVPLSFFAKSAGVYGAAFTTEYKFFSLAQLGGFLLSNWLPFTLIFLAMFMNFAHWRKAFGLVDKALAICLLLFLLYHLFLVVPVMGYAARFFYPAWPVIIWLGARSLVHCFEERPQWEEGMKKMLSGAKKWGITGLAMLLVGGMLWLQRPPELRKSWGKFGIETAYDVLGRHNWPFLDRFSILPEDLKIASTELGILAMMNPDKEIVDLSGLHDAIFARQGFDPERLVVRQAPDLIYLPHPDYAEMREELLAYEAFQSAYSVHSAEDLQSYLGIAIKRSSPYFYQMKYIIEEESGVKQ